MYCHSTETGVSRQTDTLNGGNGNARHDLQIVDAASDPFLSFARAWIFRFLQGSKGRTWSYGKRLFSSRNAAKLFVACFLLRSVVSPYNRFYFKTCKTRSKDSSPPSRISSKILFSRRGTMRGNEESGVFIHSSYQKPRYSRRKFAPIADRYLHDKCPIGRCRAPRRSLPRTK